MWQQNKGDLMPAHIFANNLPTPEERERINTAILEALRHQPGNWSVSILAAQENDALEVKIKGPAGFDWTHKFYYGEQNTAFMVAKVRAAVASNGT